MVNAQKIQQIPQGSAVIERQIDEAKTFLNALESNSLLSLKISYKHVIEYNYAVYDHLSEDLIEIDVLKRYLRKYLTCKLQQLKKQQSMARS